MTQENPATPELQERLLRLWNEGNKNEFKREVVNLITGDEAYFKILEFHSGSGAQHVVTREEFIAHFNFCFSNDLGNAIFSAISHGKDSCTVIEIRVFFQKHATVKEKAVVKDAMWLWNTLKALDLKDIDDDENLRIERHELRRHFQDQLDVALIDAIFDSIDSDGDGHISPMEYFKWRNNSELSSIQKIMHQAHKSLASPEDYVIHPIEENTSEPIANESESHQYNPSTIEGNAIEQESKGYTEEPKVEKQEVVAVDIMTSLPMPEPEPEPEPKAEVEVEVEVEVEPEVVVNHQEILTSNQKTTQIPSAIKSQETETRQETQKQERTPPASIEIQLVELVAATNEGNTSPKINSTTTDNTSPRGERDPLYPTVTREQTQEEVKLGKRRVWILSKKKTNWRECEVVAEKSDEIKVHYISYHEKYDEWIPRDSDRIRDKKEMSDLQKGDNLSAWYPKVHAWIEVEVQEIDIPHNRIKVIFVGTDDVAYISLSSPNLSLVHKELHDPFNGDEQNEYEWVSVGVAVEEEEHSQDGNNNNTMAKTVSGEDNTQTKLQQQAPPTSRNCCQIL